MASPQTRTEVIWAPQPGPQDAYVNCPVYEVFYGGARGGGKTDGTLGKYGHKAMKYGRGFNALYFRKELPSLDDAIERSQEIYGPLGAHWQEQKKQWTFQNGGRLRFRPLERIADAAKYQGQNVSDACVEEVGEIADEKIVRRLHGILRSAKGVPTQLSLTGNPGGPGHAWLRKRFYEPAPKGFKLIEEELPNGRKRQRVFIPANVNDNKILVHNDPDYISNLYMVGSDNLVKAWLHGDWDAVEGQYFDCWHSGMVIKPIVLPSHWLRFRAFDWGSKSPFAVGWFAHASEDFIEDGVHIPKGSLVMYREWYGATGPGVGLKLNNDEIAEGILAREVEEILYSVADPSIFKEDGGPSIREQMARCKVRFRKADNRRIPGWAQMRQRMKNGRLFFFDTCVDSIRSIPLLQHDERVPEDLDTNGDDHCADMVRYGCQSRPYLVKGPEEPEEMRGIADATFNEAMKLWDDEPSYEGRI